MKIPAGSYIDTSFIEGEQRVTCRYRLTTEITLWPYIVSQARYFASPADLQARHLDSAAHVAAGMAIELRRGDSQEKPTSDGKIIKTRVQDSTPDSLTFHLTGAMTDASLVHEQLFSRTRRIVLRYLDRFDDPRIVPLALEQLQLVGFEDGASLFAADNRTFEGFNHIRDYFALPQKYLGFRLTGLDRVLSQIEDDHFEIIFEFDASIPRLGSVVSASSFALYSSPAANLFEVGCTPLLIKNDEEQALVVDRSKPLNHEIYRVLHMTAQFPRSKERVPVYPLYSAPNDNARIATSLFFGSRRLQRRRTDKEHRTGLRSAYLGTETFIALREPANRAEAEPVRSLHARALVTNRHLPERLTTRRDTTTFDLVDDTSISFECIAGPTSPKESLLFNTGISKGNEMTGALLWKLLSLMQFNHLGLSPNREGDTVGALREFLMLFSDAANPSIERRIRGISAVSTRPIVRKIRQTSGFNAARGIEVRVKLDETAFEGQSAFLMGVVLKQFFAEYASLNNFIETVIDTIQRDEIKRWPASIGQRPVF
jgi:type VI secretion system protein ImpG